LKLKKSTITARWQVTLYDPVWHVLKNPHFLADGSQCTQITEKML